MYTVRGIVFLTVISVIRAVSLDLIYVEAEILDDSLTDYNIFGYHMCLLQCGKTLKCKSFYFDQNFLECRLYDHQLKNYTRVLASRKVIGLEDYVKRFANASCKQKGCSEDAVCVPPSRYRHQPVCVDEDRPKEDVEAETGGTCSGSAHMMIDAPPTIFPLNAMQENYCALAASSAFPRVVYLLRGGHQRHGILEVYSLHQKKTVGRIEITFSSERRNDHWCDVTVGVAEDNVKYLIYVAIAERVVRFKEMKRRPSGLIKIGKSKYKLFDIREPAAPLNSQEHIVITRVDGQGLLVLKNGRVICVEQVQSQEQAQRELDVVPMVGVNAGSYSPRTERLIIHTSKFCLFKIATGGAILIDIQDVHDVPILDVEWDPAGTHVYILSSKRIRKYPIPLYGLQN